MFPSSSPAIGDLDGDGKPEIAMGSVDGRVYAYDHTGPPYKWRSTITANISNNFSNLLGYIVSSPTITRTNNQKNYDDVIASFVTNGGDQLQIYILDGKNGSRTQIFADTSKEAKYPAGHPIVHWPEGYHHRGPQVTIAMNNYICIEHLAKTHTVYGNITQNKGINTTSYATPAIVEANSYSTDLRKHETGRFDIIIGAENWHLYCHAYTDTNGGEADEGSNEEQISFNNKLKRLWDYNCGSPIRSSVAVDDIDNDGKSEVIFIAENGVLSALGISNNYSSWNTERGNLHRTGDTMTKIDLPTYTMSLTENIDYGNRLDPYDDKFRVNAKIVDRTYRVESIFGNIIKGEYIVTYYDRGLMKLFDNIMAYTSAPTRNIQIKNGIWITLDIPSKIGDREYVIQGLGNRIRIYSPKSPAIFFEKEVKGSKIYGTISSISKDKYVVITSYGAYLSPNPEAG
ncbi:MAG: FG-GAP repeat protein [Candidatus Methanofastidiosum methylothiophilum]|nr:MAG: FG-GAP repeat protein [Candidatus Methanofastidiosum methylthiophilus]